jgi:predicted nucleic acid-binding protein
MERRALVLDANILIRAVLGQRVRRILEAHADDIAFFVPEPASAETDEHLAVLVVKRGGNPEKGLASLARSSVKSFTATSKPRRENVSVPAIPKTGLFLLRLLSAVPSGLRIPTSSAVASPPGR